MNPLIEDIEKDLKEVSNRMKSAIDRKNNGESIDYYEDFNKYFFVLQEIKSKLTHVLGGEDDE